eukprot:2120708-Amphidinium_carterae.1
MGSSTNVGGSCGSYGSLPYGPDRSDYRRNFDLGSQLYGSPACAPSHVDWLRSVHSANFTPCPPGLNTQVAGAGFQTQSLSFGPPATLDHVGQCAHPCSPSVHDCTRIS